MIIFWPYLAGANMKNIIKLIIIAVFNSVANASLICPSSIICNYNEGICDLPNEWLITNGSSQKSFIGSKRFDLFDIKGMKIDFPKDLYGKYRIYCWYSLEPNGLSGLIGISALATTLVGNNWVNNGSFDRSLAVCSSVIDPSNCAGD